MVFNNLVSGERGSFIKRYQSHFSILEYCGVQHCEEQHEGTQKWKDDVHQSYNSYCIIFIIAVAVVGRYCVVVAWTKTCVEIHI